MKKSIVIFPRQTYQNNTDNSKRTYVSDDKLTRLLGQAKTIRWQAVGFRISANCELAVYVYESPCDDIRANELSPGGSIYFTSTTINSLRPAPQNVTGPFSHNVVFVLEIKHSSNSGQVEWDGAIVGTLILEE